MEIKKGDKFLCIKDVIMDFTGEVTYNEGNVYTSEEDGCITNNKGNINHSWEESLITGHYFKPLKALKIKTYLSPIDNNWWAYHELKPSVIGKGKTKEESIQNLTRIIIYANLNKNENGRN